MQNGIHLGLIIDGNRRWAKLHNADTATGYKAGLDKLVEAVNALSGKGVKCISVYAFSTENEKRPAEEKAQIMSLVDYFIENHPSGVKLCFIGDFDFLPKTLKEKILSYKCEDNSYKLQMNIMLGYGARHDMVTAAKKLNNQARELFENEMANGQSYDRALKLSEEIFTEDNFLNNLSTSNLPPLDLIIRYGKANRLSNFMLYEAAYSEIYFVDKLWPDASALEIAEIVDGFKLVNRTYGG